MYKIHLYQTILFILFKCFFKPTIGLSEQEDLKIWL